MKKRALITGASSGLGKEFAYIHAKNGGDLVLVARRQEKLKEIQEDLQEMYNVSVDIIVEDLSLDGSPFRVHSHVASQGYQVDTLINNAGFGGIGLFHERSLTRDLNMIHLNICALVELTGLFLPEFVTKDAGKILNISSTASLLPGPRQAVYYATKAFVTSFSNALSGELEGTSVTVTNLMPGATETEFGSVSGMDKTSIFTKTASPEQVAQDGYDAMIDGKIDCISGLTFPQRILLSFLPLLPKRFTLRQVSSMQKTN